MHIVCSYKCNCELKLSHPLKLVRKQPIYYNFKKIYQIFSLSMDSAAMKPVCTVVNEVLTAWW